MLPQQVERMTFQMSSKHETRQPQKQAISESYPLGLFGLTPAFFSILLKSQFKLLIHGSSQGGTVRSISQFSCFPILTGLFNTLQNRGGGRILPPPNSLVFYPRSIKFGM